MPELEGDTSSGLVYGVGQAGEFRDDRPVHVHLLRERPAVGRYRAVGDRRHADATLREPAMMRDERR